MKVNVTKMTGPVLCRYNLKPDARESLYDCCNQWVEAIGSERQFMGGVTPNLADLVSELEGPGADVHILFPTVHLRPCMELSGPLKVFRHSKTLRPTLD